MPASTISSRHPANPWSKKVRAFRMDLQPISNKEFLEFVKAYPQWKKSQIAKNLHDGDYLKPWSSDETVNPGEMDHPVRYISYFVAEAYCKYQGKKLPTLDHYRIATGFKESPTMDIIYDTNHQTPELNLIHEEWTSSWWGSGLPDSGKRLKYQYRTQHQYSNPHDSNYTPEEDKRYTGRSLGFRCAEY